MTTMMRKIFFLLSLCIAVGTIHAQKITRSYQRESLSRVLEDINAATGQYEISFVYNDLEDFTVTCHFVTGISSTISTFCSAPTMRPSTFERPFALTVTCAP